MPEIVAGPSAPRFVILEDNAGRREAMQAELVAVSLPLDTTFFPDAPSCREFLRANLSTVAMLSLDHDLEPQTPESPDPGTGRDVVNDLAEQSHRPRVIIHSSNSDAASGMEFALKDVGFKVRRVYPFDDLAWVKESWIKTVRSIWRKIAAAVEPEERSTPDE